MKSKIILIIIVFIASFLRLYKLGEIPPSVISDEVSIGYNAYSILKTGRDEWGNFLPLSFPAFGDYKLPGYIYAAVPSVAVFGLNEFSTRLPSAVFGIFTVILTYFLTLELFRNKKIALVASFLFAISPWSLHLSRMAIEANVAVFFVGLGTLLFLKSLKNEKLLVPSFLSFVLTFYIYNSNRVFVPLLFTSMLILYRKELAKHKKKLITALVISFIVAFPITKYIFAQSWTGRFSKIGVTSNVGITYQINDERDFCWKTFPHAVCSLAFNKPVKYIDTIVKNYLSHYSVRFLFLSGPENLKHYSLPDFGEMYIFELPFLILGLFMMIKQKTKALCIIIPWLLFFPLASSLTSDAHPVRSAVAMPILEIITAYGIIEVFKSIKNGYIKSGILLILVIIALLNINEYFFLYYKKYSKENSQAFQYGYKEVYKLLKDEDEERYSKIVVTKKYGEPHIFYLFYNKIDPHWYQTSGDNVRVERSDKWKEVSKIGKYYFMDFSKERPKREDGALFVLNPNEVNEPLRPIKTFTYLDGKSVFHIAQ